MMIKFKFHYLIRLSFLLLILFLSSCSNSTKTINFKSESPDEFAILRKEPLVIPPNFNLRPPSVKSSNPNLSSRENNLKSAIFLTDKTNKSSKNNSKKSKGEIQLIKSIGEGKLGSRIREVLEDENRQLSKAQDGVVEKIISQVTGNGSVGKVVNPQTEVKRLQEQQSVGEITVPGQGTVIITRTTRSFSLIIKQLEY